MASKPKLQKETEKKDVIGKFNHFLFRSLSKFLSASSLLSFSPPLQLPLPFLVKHIGLPGHELPMGMPLSLSPLSLSKCFVLNLSHNTVKGSLEPLTNGNLLVLCYFLFFYFFFLSFVCLFLRMRYWEPVRRSGCAEVGDGGASLQDDWTWISLFFWEIPKCECLFFYLGPLIYLENSLVSCQSPTSVLGALGCALCPLSVVLKSKPLIFCRDGRKVNALCME